MIMQPVNVLPTFVSQDADLKTKESLASAEAGKKESEFSRLVDKHVDDEKTATTPTEPKSVIEPATASSGKTIAANGKNDSALNNTRQESDSKNGTAVNEDSKNDNKAAEVIAKEKESNLTSKDDLTDSKALDESEQFISLLYNSDKTLTNTDDKAKLTGQANQQENSVNNNTIDVLTGIASNKESSANTDEGNVVGDRSNSALLTDHKLKAFSKDELLARAQLKGSNAFAQQPSEQILKDYQQLLQSKQVTLNNQSITSEQLSKSQLANGQLENEKLANMQLQGNKISDLAVTVAQASKGLLNERVDTGLYQLPVEPIGKDKQSLDGLALSGKESAINKSEKGSEKASLLSAKALADVSSQLAAKTKQEPVDTDGSISNKAAELLNNKASDGEGKLIETKSTSPLSQTNLEKMNGERTSQSIVINEAINKEQPLGAQIKQPAMTSAQLQAVQQLQAQQKEQVVNNESSPVDDATAEYDYADSLNLSEQKVKEQGTNIGSKITDNVAARSVADIQSQTIQANQIKQNNDAYIEHQASEVLNHNVASDTAQIQKNNVQLQQETISIFKKDFADAVKDKVMVMINQKLQQFDISLDPPEFGNMQVRVNLQGEQAAVNFVVQNQQAKDALEQNMHKLREMLAEQGVDVGGANVEQQDQQQSNEENSLGQDKNTSSLSANQEEADNVKHLLSAELFDSSATGVDYYA